MIYLRKFIHYLQNHPKVFIGTILSILLIIGIIFRIITPKSPIPPTQVAYKEEVYPGVSTRQDIIDSLGQPNKESTWEDKTILNYDVQNSKWNDQFFLDSNGKLILVRELLTANMIRSKSAFIARYGEPETILYGPHSTFGQHLYLYPSKGIGFIGPEYDDGMAEIWYFAPTTKEEFVISISERHGYTTTQPSKEVE